MIVSWNGKDWLRVGECNRCGECCAFGWKQPCPYHIVNPDFTSSCRIYQQRADKNDEEALQVAGVITTACAEFPASPAELIPPSIRNRCSYQFVECERVLIACPTYGGKEYAWYRWLSAINSIEYPNYDVFVVDNSPHLDFYRRHATEVQIVYEICPPDMLGMERVCRSMETIRRRFLDGGYSRWLNIEADVIVPPDIISTMLKLGQGVDWLAHAYPSRGYDQWGDPSVESLCGIGCSMLSRNMMEKLNWQGSGAVSPDCHLWEQVRRAKCFKTIELWGILKLEHLRG